MEKQAKSEITWPVAKKIQSWSPSQAPGCLSVLLKREAGQSSRGVVRSGDGPGCPSCVLTSGPCPGPLSPPCAVDEDDGSCEVNGRRYLDGETFKPNCRVLCRCDDGGFTCLPLCSEDVRLPSWDCPRPKRIQVPGKCCPEWVCDQGVTPAIQRSTAQGE